MDTKSELTPINTNPKVIAYGSVPEVFENSDANSNESTNLGRIRQLVTSIKNKSSASAKCFITCLQNIYIFICCAIMFICLNCIGWCIKKVWNLISVNFAYKFIYFLLIVIPGILGLGSFGFHWLILFDCLAKETQIKPTINFWHQIHIVVKTIIIIAELIIFSKNLSTIHMQATQTGNQCQNKKNNKINTVLVISVILMTFLDGFGITLTDVYLDFNQFPSEDPLFKCVNENKCGINENTTIYKCRNYLPNCTLAFTDETGILPVLWEIFIKRYNVKFSTNCEPIKFHGYFLLFKDITHSVIKYFIFLFSLIYFKIAYNAPKSFDTLNNNIKEAFKAINNSTFYEDYKTIVDGYEKSKKKIETIDSSISWIGGLTILSFWLANLILLGDISFLFERAHTTVLTPGNSVRSIFHIILYTVICIVIIYFAVKVGSESERILFDIDEHALNCELYVRQFLVKNPESSQELRDELIGELNLLNTDYKDRKEMGRLKPIRLTMFGVQLDSINTVVSALTTLILVWVAYISNSTVD